MFSDPDLFIEKHTDDQGDRIDEKGSEVAGEFQFPGELIHPYFDDRFNDSDADKDGKDRVQDLEPCLLCFGKKTAKGEADKGLSDWPGNAEGSAFE